MNLELTRHHARRFFPYDSLPYRTASEILSAWEIISKEGWGVFRQLKSLTRDTGVHELHLRCLMHPITIRDVHDDIYAIVNNAIREEWGQFNPTIIPRVIIDAGAYIGDTAAYFLSRFPATQVIALEPNPETYSIAAKNLNPYGSRAILHHAALWSEPTTLRLTSGDMETQVHPMRGSITVSTETIPSLMSKHKLTHIDVLKVDIEGAEEEVIPSGVDSWLDKVGMILLETHSSEGEKSLISLLANCGFDCLRFRNAWYCQRKRINAFVASN